LLVPDLFLSKLYIDFSFFCLHRLETQTQGNTHMETQKFPQTHREQWDSKAWGKSSDFWKKMSHGFHKKILN